MQDRYDTVVLLTIDALRADHLSCHGYHRATSPVLDDLAATGVQCSHAYSASSHTREAISALLTGRYPDACVDDDFALVADTLATQLRETTYTTGAFHSNPYVSRAYGYGQDFDAFDDDLYFGQHKLVALAQRVFDKVRKRHYARAETITERALDFVDAVAEPCFLWAHYMDPHGPYCPPDEYQTLFHDEPISMTRAQRLYKRAWNDPESITDAERRELVNCYDGEIRYVDAQVGAFLDGLEQRGLLANSLVIVTADHGDMFGEHGHYGHPRRLYDEVLHVPLVVRGPGVPDTTVEGPVSTLDVWPTVLDAVDGDGQAGPGESLLAIANDPTAVADRRAFSQVRTAGDEPARRRFSVRTSDGICRLERAIPTGEVTAGPMGDDDLAEAVRAHSAARLDAVTDAGEGEGEGETESDEHGEGAGPDTASAAVKRRLEALGYKQ